MCDSKKSLTEGLKQAENSEADWKADYEKEELSHLNKETGEWEVVNEAKEGDYDYNKKITADDLRELTDSPKPKTTITILTYIDNDGVQRCLHTGRPFSEIKKWMEE